MKDLWPFVSARGREERREAGGQDLIYLLAKLFVFCFILCHQTLLEYLCMY
jgi:hypothetical protein